MSNTHPKRSAEVVLLIDPMMPVILQPIDRSVTVIHDGKRCYGYIQRIVSGFWAFWSGDRFDDHLIGEFKDRAEAVRAVVREAQSNG